MRLLLALFVAALIAFPAAAATERWATSWTASAQGPYPVGNPSAQPDLRFAFPAPEAGSNDQSFRLILRPDIWGRAARLRFSNSFGTKPVTFDGVYVALQMSGAALVPHTSRAVAFAGKRSVTVPAGGEAWSDAVVLPYARDPKSPALAGRKLAVSFHVVGESGPMTWHAKALTTSYLSRQGAGATGAEESEAAFPFSTASWYFLDAVDMMAPAGTKVVVAFGDSITDGTASTMNGDDRWPDVLSRRLHAAYGNRFVIVNEGIGGNQVVGPAQYTPQQPFAGGPSAGDRLERDVLSLSSVGAVIWLEGINDLGKQGEAKVETVEDGMKRIVARIRARYPDAPILGATLISALGSTNAAHGYPSQDIDRRTLNDFIRTSGLFDGIVDFDKATLDSANGSMQAMFVPESTTGGPGDKLHPNRAGYQAMGNAVDLKMLTARTKH